MLQEIPCISFVLAIILCVIFGAVFGVVEWLIRLKQDKIGQKRARAIRAFVIPVRIIIFSVIGIGTAMMGYKPMMVPVAVILLFIAIMIACSIWAVVDVVKEFREYVNEPNNSTSPYSSQVFVTFAMIGATVFFITITFGPLNPFL